jgi:hydrogenase maturation protease
MMTRTRDKSLMKEFHIPTTLFSVNRLEARRRSPDRDSRTKSGLSDVEATVTTNIHGAGVRCNTLVLGMGSEFLGDDGLGVHALRALSNESLPPGTELIEIANHLVDSLVALQKADRIILLDVLRAKGKPGSVYRVSFQPVQMPEGIPLSYSPDFFRALHLGGCFGFLDIIVIAMEPSVIDWSTNLSQEVGDALPLMIRAVKAELSRPVMGCSIEDTIAFMAKLQAEPFSEGLGRSLQ